KPGAGKRIRLVESRYGVVYAPTGAGSQTGYLLFIQGANLMAQALDPGTLKLSGEAALVAQDVGGSESNGYIDLSASRTGVLAYGTVTQASRRLVWLDRDGNRREPVSDAGLWYFARVSPDGGSLAVLHYEAGRPDVWLIDSRDARQKFTFSG